MEAIELFPAYLWFYLIIYLHFLHFTTETHETWRDDSAVFLL